MDLNQLQKIEVRLKQINVSMIQKLIAEELQKNGAEIVELVRNRWLRGKRPDGKDIGSYKDFGYEMFKRQQNPLAGGKVDLTLDGGLNKGLVVNYLRGSISNIFSTDEKAVMIAKRYGLDVYGLSNKETELVLERAKDNVFIKLYQSVFK